MRISDWSSDVCSSDLRSAVRDLLVRRGQRKPVERTDDRPNGLCCDLRVEGRRVYLGEAEQDLDDADVDAIFEKMGGETVPQRVRSDPLVDVRCQIGRAPV